MHLREYSANHRGKRALLTVASAAYWMRLIAALSDRKGDIRLGLWGQSVAKPDLRRRTGGLRVCNFA